MRVSYYLSNSPGLGYNVTRSHLSLARHRAFHLSSQLFKDLLSDLILNGEDAISSRLFYLPTHIFQVAMQHKKKVFGEAENGCELNAQGGARSNEKGPGDDVVDNENGAGALHGCNDSEDEVSTMIETPPASPPPYNWLYQQGLIANLRRENNALRLENRRLHDQNDEANVLLEDVMVHYRNELEYSRNKTETLTAIMNFIGEVRNGWDWNAELGSVAADTDSVDAADGDLPDMAFPYDEEPVIEGNGGIATDAEAAHAEDYASANGLSYDNGEGLRHGGGNGIMPDHDTHYRHGYVAADGLGRDNGEGLAYDNGNDIASDQATYEHEDEHADEDQPLWPGGPLPRPPFQYFDEEGYALLRVEFGPGNNVSYSW